MSLKIEVTETPQYVAVSGQTYPIKNQLRELGLRWHAESKEWRLPRSRRASEILEVVDTLIQCGAPSTAAHAREFSAMVMETRGIDPAQFRRFSRSGVHPGDAADYARF